MQVHPGGRKFGQRRHQKGEGKGGSTVWYWIGAFVAWLIGLAWIVSLMSDVIRGKKSGLSPMILAGYAVHGVFAVLALWLVFKALGA
jgi:hypothetical protein